MNSYSRQLSELNKNKNDLLGKLSFQETELGHKLYTNKESSISAENFDSYKSILSNLEDQQKSLEQVLELQQTITETENDISQDKKSLNELQKPLNEKYAALGKFLYSIYSDNLYEAFGSTYIEAKQEESVIETLNEQQNQLKTDMVKQGFFPKLMSQAKLSANKASIALHQKKISDILTKGAKESFENSSLTDIVSGAEYEDCLNQKNAIDNQVNHILFLTDSLQNAKDKLSEFPKPAKLQSMIDSQKNLLDSTALKIGISYSSEYISKEAETLKEFPKKYTELLENKLSIVKQILENQRQTEIVQFDSQIDEATQAVFNIEKNIQSNNQKIESLIEANKDLETQKEATEVQIKELQTKKADLEADTRFIN